MRDSIELLEEAKSRIEKEITENYIYYLIQAIKKKRMKQDELDAAIVELDTLLRRNPKEVYTKAFSTPSLIIRKE